VNQAAGRLACRPARRCLSLLPIPTGLHPVRCQNDVFHPSRPGGVGEVSGAVPAAGQIDLHDLAARAGQCARLQRRHSARLVHLLAERVYEDRLRSGRAATGRMMDDEARAAAATACFKEEGVKRGRL